MKEKTIKDQLDDENKDAVIVKICLVIGFTVIIVGLIFFFGYEPEKKVHRTTEFLEWDEKPVFIVIKFTSSGSSFSTGQSITVKPTIAFEFTGKDNPQFFLNLPKALDIADYEELVTLDDELTTSIEEHAFEYKIPTGWSYHGVFPGLLAKSFDVIWTQEGLQNGKLVILHPNASKNKEIDLEGIINIQPSELRLQLTASQKANGLVIMILGLSIIIAIPGFVKLRKRKI